jgi:hypothetical protein
MAKLRADITYKRRKQESLLLNSTMTNIGSEQYLNLDNLDEQNKETDPNNNGNDELNHIDESEESDEDINDKDVDIEEQFQNQIDRCLEIDDDNDLDLDDINVENIDHPAQNKDAKWKLDIIFKDNLHCPFE